MRRRQSILTLFTAIVVFVLNCSEKTTQPQRIELGDQFEIGLGKTASIESEQLSITFSNVSFDFRCSALQNCDWPGLVEASLEVKHGNEGTVHIDLALAGDSDPAASAVNANYIGEYRIELVSVTPLPVRIDQVTHEVKDSVGAVLKVTKSTGENQDLSGPSRISEVPLDSIPSTNAEILSCLLESDTLTLSVRAANPCIRHYYELNLNSSPEMEAGIHSYTVWMRHTTSQAVCGGPDTVMTLKFDLSSFQGFVDQAVGFGREKEFRVTEFNEKGVPSTRQFAFSYWGPEAPNNLPPNFQSVAPISIRFGQTLDLEIRVHDPENVPTDVAVTELPEGATFNSLGNGKGLLKWTPTIEQHGDFQALFAASDGYRSSSLTVSISVRSNVAPAISEIVPGNTIELHRGDTLRFTMSAADGDGDRLVYSLTPSQPPCIIERWPDGSGITVTAATIGWNERDFDFSLVASDGVFADTATVAVRVLKYINYPPEFSGSDTTINMPEGTSEYVVLEATDKNLDPLTFRAVYLPPSAYFDPLPNNRMQVHFHPNYRQHDVYLVYAIVNDGSEEDTLRIRFVVTDRNSAPRMNFVSGMGCVSEQLVTSTISAVDGDGDPLAFTMTGAPAGASLLSSSDTTAEFFYLGSETDLGEHQITFSVTDGIESDSRQATLIVADYSPEETGLIPMAIGNYWVYSSWDSVFVIGAQTERDTMWWHLSKEFGPFTEKIRIGSDTLFSTFGPELITPIDTAISYPVFVHFREHIWFHSERTARILTEPVTVSAGTFTNCIEYTVYSRCYWSGFTGYHERYTIAPGVGIVKVFRFQSECTLMSGRTSESELLRYHLGTE